MLSRFLFVSLVAVCLLCTVSPSHAAGPAADPGVTSPPTLGFGVDGAFLSDPTTFARAKDAGAKWVRAGLYWKNIEPTDRAPANYDWTQSDLDLETLLDSDLIPVVLVTRTPAWAGPYECGPIDTTDSNLMADFGEFMGALATHYPGVRVWVLYNEVDSAVINPGFSDGCFGNDVTGDLNGNGVQDTADYAEMLAAARKAVRQVNATVQVAISVAFDNFDTATCPPGYPGGCPPNSTMNFHFLPDLFAYMAAHPRPNGEAYADLIGFNYFDIYGGYWQSQTGTKYRGVQAKAQFIRTLMQNGGVSFKLYVGETGEDSGLASVGLDGQSQCLVTEMVRGAATGLEGTSWWLIKDVPEYNWYYGLVDASLNPKPAHKAYQILVQQLQGMVFDKSLGTKQVEAYQFARKKNKTTVLWSAVVATHSAIPCADTRTTKKFTFKNVKKLTRIDLYNATKTVIADNKKGDLDKRIGYIKIKIGSQPVYIRYKQ